MIKIITVILNIFKTKSFFVKNISEKKIMQVLIYKINVIFVLTMGPYMLLKDARRHNFSLEISIFSINFFNQ